MKYLGLTLDSHWSFKEHFGRLIPRLRVAVSNLGRLLPNLGGPRDGVRRLYMGVATSIALYGAPVWANDLAASQSSVKLLHGEQRKLAIRLARGYRTIPYEAACAVTGTAPWVIVAESYSRLYEGRKELLREGAVLSAGTVKALKLQARQLVMEAWQEELAHARAGLRAVEAIRPVLVEWADRRHGGLTFRLVQVLTGLGCFGEYLHDKARRKATTRCHHCVEDRDTAQHTLEHCPAPWAPFPGAGNWWRSLAAGCSQDDGRQREGMEGSGLLL